MKSGYYWAKYVDHPIWAVYYILDDEAYPCSPNRLASRYPIRDLLNITPIEPPNANTSNT